MTTIVWKQGVLACDRKMTDGGIAWRMRSKLIRGKDCVYSVAGAWIPGNEFIRQIEEGEEPDRELVGKVTIVAMDLKTGQITEYEDGIPVVLSGDTMMAWGSGRELALGALSMGATPKEAVKAAAAWDIYTGMGVEEVVSERAKSRNKAK